jgi:hypothetical protein
MAAYDSMSCYEQVLITISSEDTIRMRTHLQKYLIVFKANEMKTELKIKSCTIQKNTTRSERSDGNDKVVDCYI